MSTPAVPGFSWQRVGAVMLRHLYVLRSSWPRLLELAYWPFVQMITWGFVTRFFLDHSSWVAQAAGVLISAVLLWDILFRANLGVSLSFMEEMWARNLGQLYVSPLRPIEHVAALMSMSLIRTVISVTPAALLSLPLYDVWIFSLGPPLIVFFINLLVFGWSIGLVVAALVLRFGMGAESLAWVAIFAFAPLSGIYYPISTLPEWLQPVSMILPSSHVFEGMRAVLLGEGFRMDHFLAAVGLNVVYLTLAGGWFLFTLHVARIKGLLLQQGE
ncbi:ABC transporter permease [Magnetospira thiophila]